MPPGLHACCPSLKKEDRREASLETRQWPKGNPYPPQSRDNSLCLLRKQKTERRNGPGHEGLQELVPITEDTQGTHCGPGTQLTLSHLTFQQSQGDNVLSILKISCRRSSDLTRATQLLELDGIGIRDHKPDSGACCPFSHMLLHGAASPPRGQFWKFVV